MSLQVEAQVLVPQEEVQPLADHSGAGVHGIPFHEIRFDPILGPTKHPVHEYLTTAAFQEAGDPLWTNADPSSANTMDYVQWEWIRGLYWNDDPDCDLFKSKHNTNHAYSKGAKFGAKFGWGKLKNSSDADTILKYDLLTRSHFFDLQFIHAMAPAMGIPAADTRSQCMMWAEFTYLVATGTIAVDRTLNAASAQLSPTNPCRLDTFFTTTTTVKGTDTVEHLFCRDDQYTAKQPSRRAMGSLLHLIQDSYALCHTERDTLPTDGNQNNYADCGAIRRFRCYKNQDTTAHGYWDNMPLAAVNPSRPDTFSFWPGAERAIHVCAQMIRYVNQPGGAAKWEEVEAYLLKDVFNLVNGAAVSDNSVHARP